MKWNLRIPAFRRIAVLLIGIVAGLAGPARVSGQEPGTGPAVDALSARLPNPDGRDPVLDRRRSGELVEIEFFDATGRSQRTLDQFPARVRLVNFWATWCVPCIRELPSLSELVNRYPENRLRVIPISLDRAELDVVRDFLGSIDAADLDWHFDDSRQSGLQADVRVLPTTVFVAHDGRELGRIVGSADWTSAEATRLLDALIELAGNP